MNKVNRWLVFCTFCVVSLFLTFMVDGTFGQDDQDNATYHENKIPYLVGIASHEIGDFSYVILHIACEVTNSDYPASRNTSLWKAVYFPKVDEFTELRNNFTQSLLHLPNVNVRVWLEFPTFEMRSESRVMLYKYDPNTTKTAKKELLVGSRAITIVMDEGVITDSYWDDSCASCTEDKCIEDSCSSDISNDIRPSCYDQQALDEDPFRCGLKIYVAFAGTDKNNKTLTSYTSVPSRFQKYSFIASAYDAAAGFSSDFISFWKQPLN